MVAPRSPEAGSRCASAAPRQHAAEYDRSLSDRWERVPRQTSALGTVRRASRSRVEEPAPNPKIGGRSSRRSVLLRLRTGTRSKKRSPGTPIEGGEEGIPSLTAQDKSPCGRSQRATAVSSLGDREPSRGSPPKVGFFPRPSDEEEPRPVSCDLENQISSSGSGL